MHEMHAVANGDGTYTVDVITIIDHIPRHYQVKNAKIVMDDVVADEAAGTPQFVQFTVNQG